MTAANALEAPVNQNGLHPQEAEENRTDLEMLGSAISRTFPEFTGEMAATAAAVLMHFSPAFATRTVAIFRETKEASTADIDLLKRELLRCARLHYENESAPFDATRGGRNNLDTVINDMGLLHDAPPHGVPAAWSWANVPRLGLGNNPGEWTQFTAWGQIYEAANGNNATNTRLEIKDLEAFYLSRRDNQWHKLQGAMAGQSGGKLHGARYVEDFANNENRAADTREEPDGGLSVTLDKGHNFHFYPAARAEIDPEDIAGVFATARARTIVADPNQPDDRANARYLMNVGADYWLKDAHWDHLKNNNDAGIGRFKYVTPAWQSFNMTTLSGVALRRNPPPMNDQ